MDLKEKEYKELFIGEALDNYEELNNLITGLEKDPESLDKINAIFRITHTLKGNATGMGFEAIAEVSHVMEDLFDAVKSDEVTLEEGIFNDLFKAVDVLGALIDSLKTEKVVRYKGIKTKLEVFLRNKRAVSTTASKPEVKKEKVKSPKAASRKVEAKKAPVKKTPAKKTVSKKVEEVEAKGEVVEEKKKETKLTVASIAENYEAELDKFEEETSAVVSEITFSDMVQIPVRKLDNLLNLVGELVIEKDRLGAINSEKNGRNNELSRLTRISSDLQYSVMDVRLVQVGFLFNKFHRVVRDAAVIEHKKVQLNLEGTETEIDRNILQIISDSLIHLIRNAVGHGIETPEEREKAGKPEEGQIVLSARNESETVIVDIKDDGKGIDANVIRNLAVEKGLITKELSALKSDDEILYYIFEPGFSSAAEVNAISGRGVGMDVVKRAIDSIGGNIKIETEIGIGTTMSLSLPSSMAVKASLLFELGKTEYAIPLVYTEAVLTVVPDEIFSVGSKYVTNYLGRTIGLVSLKEIMIPGTEGVFDEDLSLGKLDKINVVVISYNNKLIGLVVDKLLQQKEIVEKPMMKPLDDVKSISGVTILGNGNVCLVLNVPNIMNVAFNQTMMKTNKGVLI